MDPRQEEKKAIIEAAMPGAVETYYRMINAVIVRPLLADWSATPKSFKHAGKWDIAAQDIEQLRGLIKRNLQLMKRFATSHGNVNAYEDGNRVHADREKLRISSSEVDAFVEALAIRALWSSVQRAAQTIEPTQLPDGFSE